MSVPGWSFSTCSIRLSLGGVWKGGGGIGGNEGVDSGLLEDNNGGIGGGKGGGVPSLVSVCRGTIEK